MKKTVRCGSYQKAGIVRRKRGGEGGALREGQKQARKLKASAAMVEKQQQW
jgi:hypothetical protein